MKVIISSDYSCRIIADATDSTPLNIETDIKFYIDKTLSYSDISLIIEDVYTINSDIVLARQYPFALIQTDDIRNYNIYKIFLTYAIQLNEKAYNLKLCIDEKEVLVADDQTQHFNLQEIKKIIEVDNLILIDQDPPIPIENKTILINKVNQPIIVAEDAKSQVLTFQVRRVQEGIDLAAMIWHFDYIDPIDIEHPLKNILIPTATIVKDTNYIYIPFEVPYSITELGKNSLETTIVRFALSATSDYSVAGASLYIWQTLPAELIISANLYPRNLSVNVEEDAEVLEIRSRLENIENSDIFNVENQDAAANGEVTFEAPSASYWED